MAQVKENTNEIYFDTAATTPLLPEVKDAIVQSLDIFGNPSSLHHHGVMVQKKLNQARQQVLQALGVQSGQVIFTGGGTEANNLALFGAARKYQRRGRHIVTTQIEHPSVLESCRELEKQGWQVTYIAPENDGTVAVDRVLKAVTDETVLVSMMHVNNETGAKLPVEEVGEELKKQPRVLFHVDGIQAFGRVTETVQFADLYSISGHKIGAPKGIGALYLRPNLQIDPVLFGGGQENGLRSGTENVLGILTLGVAANLAHAGQRHAHQRVEQLAALLIDGLRSLPGCIVKRPSVASPYIVHAAFPGLKGEVLVHAFESQGLYVSTGSACSTKGGQAKASHVLLAMGSTQQELAGSLRFSLGTRHIKEDVERALFIVREQTKWLQSLI